jgi:hypothetical protein
VASADGWRFKCERTIRLIPISSKKRTPHRLLLRPFQHLGHRHRIPCGVVEPRDSHLRKFQAAINRHTEESRCGLEEHRVRVQQTPRGIEVGFSDQYLLFQSIKNLL